MLTESHIMLNYVQINAFDSTDIKPSSKKTYDFKPEERTSHEKILIKHEDKINHVVLF